MRNPILFNATNRCDLVPDKNRVSGLPKKFLELALSLSSAAAGPIRDGSDWRQPDSSRRITTHLDLLGPISGFRFTSYFNVPFGSAGGDTKVNRH